MTSSRTRRSAPPTTASARPRSRTAAAATRSARPASTASPTFSRPSSASSWTRAAHAERGARRRPALRPRADLEEAFTGVEKTHHRRGAGDVRARATAAAAPSADHCASDLPDLRRHGQGPRAAGLLRGRARLPDLPRRGRGDHRPVPQLPRRGPRARSQRKLSVKIPAGVDEGTRIRVAGEGEAGVRGAASGDLYLFVHMKRHPIYAREGTTLIADCPVSFTTAALGGSISLPGIDGNAVEIKIPAGHPVGRAAAPSRIGHERAQRPRPRRPGRAHPGRNADPDDRQAEEAARGIPRHRNRRRMPGRRRASSAACATMFGG